MGSKQDAVDYLTWTFFFRRLVQNPSYYDLPGTEADQLSIFLSRMIEATLESLQASFTLALKEQLQSWAHFHANCKGLAVFALITHPDNDTGGPCFNHTFWQWS